jgi:hypothetical protein
MAWLQSSDEIGKEIIVAPENPALALNWPAIPAVPSFYYWLPMHAG